MNITSLQSAQIYAGQIVSNIITTVDKIIFFTENTNSTLLMNSMTMYGAVQTTFTNIVAHPVISIIKLDEETILIRDSPIYLQDEPSFLPIVYNTKTNQQNYADVTCAGCINKYLQPVATDRFVYVPMTAFTTRARLSNVPNPSFTVARIDKSVTSPTVTLFHVDKPVFPIITTIYDPGYPRYIYIASMSFCFSHSCRS
jgi:hypothetical protein